MLSMDLAPHPVFTDPVSSMSLCSNGEFLEFVKHGGYNDARWWSAEGWKWRTFRNAKWPTFWVPDGPAGLHQYRLRLVFEDVAWAPALPAVVNFHEAKAFCAWLSDKHAVRVRALLGVISVESAMPCLSHAILYGDECLIINSSDFSSKIAHVKCLPRRRALLRTACLPSRSTLGCAICSCRAMAARRSTPSCSTAGRTSAAAPTSTWHTAPSARWTPWRPRLKGSTTWPGTCGRCGNVLLRDVDKPMLSCDRGSRDQMRAHFPMTGIPSP